MSYRKKILIGLGAVLLLGALFLISEHVRGRLGLARWRKDALARGEKLTLRELIPATTPEQNAFPELMAAGMHAGGSPNLILSEANRFRLVAPGKVVSMLRQEQWSLSKDDAKRAGFTNMDWRMIEERLEPMRAPLAEARAATARPHFDARLDDSTGFTMNLSHLARMRGLAQHFCAEAMVDLHQGKTPEAVDAMIASLRLAKLLQEEPIVISQLVALAVAGVAWPATWRALDFSTLDERQLARLQAAWEQMDYIRATALGLEGDRALFAKEMAMARNDLTRLDRQMSADYDDMMAGMMLGPPPSFSSTEIAEQLMKGTVTNGRRYVLLPLFRFAWLDFGELRYNEAMQQLIDAHRRAAREGSGQAAIQTAARVEEELGKATGLEVPRSQLRRITMPSLMKLTKRAAGLEAQKAMAIAAIALHRHRLRHGRWPVTLAALAPEFLPAVPRDFYDGAPLRYKLREDGTFLLYSIGENALDDGGSPQPEKGGNPYLLNGLDLVWPARATPEEIEAAAKIRK